MDNALVLYGISDSDSDKSLAVGGKGPANVRTRIQRLYGNVLYGISLFLLLQFEFRISKGIHISNNSC